MANTSLKAVFERFWQHVQLALEPKADKTVLGSLEDLTTENKENLVAAINEVANQDVDSELSETSTNPVQNKVITSKLIEIDDKVSDCTNLTWVPIEENKNYTTSYGFRNVGSINGRFVAGGYYLIRPNSILNSSDKVIEVEGMYSVSDSDIQVMFNFDKIDDFLYGTASILDPYNIKFNDKLSYAIQDEEDNTVTYENISLLELGVISFTIDDSINMSLSNYEYWEILVSTGSDSALSINSLNPVQNKVITAKLNEKVDKTEIGSLDELTTSDKSSLVAAINEAATKTGGGGSGENIQSDWNESDTASDAYIKNKPTIPTKLPNPHKLTITQAGTTLGEYDGSEVLSVDIPVSSGGVTIEDVDSELSETSTNPVQNKVITAKLNEKVDKIDGMGLSSNDFTTAEKTKLANLVEGAEINVQADWKQTNETKDDYIKNKPTIPTKLPNPEKLDICKSRYSCVVDEDANKITDMTFELGPNDTFTLNIDNPEDFSHGVFFNHIMMEGPGLSKSIDSYWNEDTYDDNIFATMQDYESDGSVYGPYTIKDFVKCINDNFVDNLTYDGERSVTFTFTSTDSNIDYGNAFTIEGVVNAVYDGSSKVDIDLSQTDVREELDNLTSTYQSIVDEIDSLNSDLTDSFIFEITYDSGNTKTIKVLGVEVDG